METIIILHYVLSCNIFSYYVRSAVKNLCYILFHLPLTMIMIMIVMVIMVVVVVVVVISVLG